MRGLKFERGHDLCFRRPRPSFADWPVTAMSGDGSLEPRRAAKFVDVPPIDAHLAHRTPVGNPSTRGFLLSIPGRLCV